MKQRRILLLLLLLGALALVGCGPKPEETINGFMDQVKNFNLEGAGQYVAGDKANVEEDIKESFDQEEIPESVENYLKDKAKKIEYKIGEVKEDGDKAVAKVKFKYVDSTELVTKTISQFIQESLTLSLADANTSDEKFEEMLESIFNKNLEQVEDRFVEKDLDVNLVKEKDKWLIEDLDDNILDVVLANFNSIFKDLDKMDMEDHEEAEIGDREVVEFSMDQTMELSTLKVKVNKLEELDKLTNSLGEETLPVEGAKFILLDLDVENKTKESMQLWPLGFDLLDEKERIYESYDNSIGSVENYMDGRTIGAGLKENGIFVYEVPEDAKNFKLMMGHADTNEVYLMNLE